jgi:hypothetical protein
VPNGSSERRKELRNAAISAMRSKIEEPIEALLRSGFDQDVGWESTAGRSTTTHDGQEIYSVFIDVKVRKIGTEV